jgi:tetratricopeptide (TPR) repeat protein
VKAVRETLVGLAIASTATLAPAAAFGCPWDDESYQAEANSLPCVMDAVLGAYLKHSNAFYQTRLRAADAVLEWAPAHLEALDAKGVALLKLRRLKDAEAVMVKRAALAPNAYASHANLGTVYTFTGDWEKALAAIDKAMAIEPRAHFGREKYHRQLVEYLRDLAADPSLAMRENFLRIPVDPAARLAGSKEAFARSGAQEDAFDAIVSMITVYGAEGVSHVYFALGELLALRGDRRLAWTAYKRAEELKHPRAKELGAWRRALDQSLRDEYKRDPKAWVDRIQEFEGFPMPYSKVHPSSLGSDDIYAGIGSVYWKIKHDGEYASYRGRVREFMRWEEKEISKGLPVWRAEGLEKVCARANELRPRCKSPGVILHEPLTQERR